MCRVRSISVGGYAARGGPFGRTTLGLRAFTLRDVGSFPPPSLVVLNKESCSAPRFRRYRLKIDKAAEICSNLAIFFLGSALCGQQEMTGDLRMLVDFMIYDSGSVPPTAIFSPGETSQLGECDDSKKTLRSPNPESITPQQQETAPHHEVVRSAAGQFEEALVPPSNRLFQALDLYWRSPESGDL